VFLSVSHEALLTAVHAQSPVVVIVTASEIAAALYVRLLAPSP
jgi:hypothetical protein